MDSTAVLKVEAVYAPQVVNEALDGTIKVGQVHTAAAAATAGFIRKTFVGDKLKVTVKKFAGSAAAVLGKNNIAKYLATPSMLTISLTAGISGSYSM